MRALRWIVAIIALGGAAWISAGLLAEAYGAGPPYYGRTVNMDKWTSPWPVVGASVVIASAIAIVALRPWLKGRRGHNKAK